MSYSYNITSNYLGAYIITADLSTVDLTPNNPPTKDTKPLPNSTSKLGAKLTAMVAGNQPTKTYLPITPMGSIKDSNDNYYVTSDENKKIDEYLDALNFPYYNYSRKQIKSSMEEQLNTTKKHARDILGKPLGPTSDHTIKELADNYQSFRYGDYAKFINFQNVITDNSYLNPKETAALSNIQPPTEFPFTNDHYHTALTILKNMVSIIDVKTDHHLSKDDIHHLWVQVQNNLKYDIRELRTFDRSYIGNTHYAALKKGFALLPQDYKLMLSEYDLSDGEKTSIEKYAHEQGIPKDIIFRLVVVENAKTGGHMSDQDIKKLSVQKIADINEAYSKSYCHQENR